jgi:hypothetical protein
MNAEAEKPRQTRRWWGWLTLLCVATVGVGIFVLVARDWLQHRINVGLAKAIEAQLGAGASVGRVEAGWRRLEIEDIRLTLDRGGTSLCIPRLEAYLQPLAVVEGGHPIEQVLRSVRLYDPVLILSRRAAEHGGDQPWLPQFRLPPKLFKTVDRLGGLQRVSVERGEIRAASASDTMLLATDLHAVVTRSGGDELRMAAEGFVGGDSNWIVTLKGDLVRSARRLRAAAQLTIPQAEFPLGRSPRPVLEWQRGSAAMQLQATDSGVSYEGEAELFEPSLSLQDGSILFDSIRLRLAGDSLQMNRTEFRGSSLDGWLAGALRLRGAGGIHATGEATAEGLRPLREWWPGFPEADGRVNVVFAAAGDLRAPLCRAQITSRDLEIAQHRLNEFQADVAVGPERVEIRSLSLECAEGRGWARASIGLDKAAAWNAEGAFDLSREPSLLGWAVGVRHLRFSGGGTSAVPVLDIALCDSAGREMCRGLIEKQDERWHLQLRSPEGEAGEVSVAADAGGVQVAAQDVHRLIVMFLPDWRPLLSPVRRLDVRFVGGSRSGEVHCDLEMRPDTGSLLSRLAQQIHVGGDYKRVGSSAVTFEGRWSGVAGNGAPFDGQAALSLRDRVLRIERCFIDTVGRLSGYVDFGQGELDLEASVDNLPLFKLPIPQSFLDRVQLQGTLAGHARLRGSLARPDWQGSFAMINGSAFGVPDYWLNLELEGSGAAAVVRILELGRGVRKILVASGELDGKSRQVALAVELGAVRAEDFVLALTGRRAVISGELDGRGTIVGTLPGLDVEAELQVHEGELLNEICVDEFSASLQLMTDESGLRVLRVPACAFSKKSVYEFHGYAEVLPKDEGALRAHIEGSGDFLDILDQMDRAFRTEGSQGDFRLDFGGTLSKPLLLGGHLTVHGGRFVYPDATAGTVGTEINIGVSASGAIDTGLVVFRSGDRWLEIRALPGCDSLAATGLQPLRIPRAQLCLGVLALRTGEDGMPLRLPGLMKSEWLGDFVTGSDGVPPITISARDDRRLWIEGGIRISNARVTFPFVGGGSGHMRTVARWIVSRLQEAQWNLDVAVSTGNHYDVEITGLKNSEVFAPLRNSLLFERLADYFDHLSIDAIVDPADQLLQIRGTIADTSFFLNGRLAAHRGKVEYLDQTFVIDNVYSDFDETDVMPILEGRATTNGQDTLGRQVPVYLTMYQIDRETGARQRRGRLSNITFVLEDDAADASEQVLKLLGYDLGDVKGKASELVASTVVRTIGRQWLDPLERRLERWTLLDEIAFTPGKGRWSSVSRQQRQHAQADTLQQNSAVRFFSGSQVTVGKYLTRDVFLTYTGELAEGGIDLGNRLGFVHLWNLEYRILPLSRDLVLDLAVEYDEVERKRDESISLKYSFALEP